jgi:phosphoribosylglycinamide formyltransferase-1
MLISKTKTAVLVSGGGTNLQAMIDARDKGEMPHCELSLVVSNRAGAFALERAKKAGIPSQVLSGKDFADKEDYDSALLRVLDDFQIEFVVYAGFLRVLGKTFTDRFQDRCINIHPALLPRFGGKGMYGLHVHEAVLAAGEKVTGATVHYATEILDGGKIILQKEVSVLHGDTPESLQKRVMEQGEWLILPKVTEDCCYNIYKSNVSRAIYK